MGVEVAGSNLLNVNEEGKTKLHDKKNGKYNGSEPITFGSHGINEQQAHFPKDAVEEWPEPQVHYFWFIKHRIYEDPNLKAKIDQTEREIQTMNRRRSQIIESLKPKQSARAELVATLRSLGAESSKYWAAINERRQEMKPLQDALGTLRGSGRGVSICSSEEELNKLIRSLEYQMQHESLTLKEEKQLMREIKDLEATRLKVVANSAIRAKIEESLGQKDVLQDQVKLLGTDLDGVRKQKEEIKAKMDQLGDQLKALNNQITPLQQDLEALTNKRDEAFEVIRDLRKKRDEGNKLAYENRAIINTAREVAARKDVKGLEEYVEAEVEKFMSNWNSSKGFRDDYQKRILTSLDVRQLSRDGRMRNPDEKPLVAAEPPRRETVVVPKATPKVEKEDPKVTPIVENLHAQKVQKESKKKSTDSKPALEQLIEEEDVFVVEKPKQDVSKENGIDEAKLKEMKKEEEREKQRQALERKKKLQEKAAAKASLRAQREAEKKQKERERKLKKKEVTTSAGPATSEEEPTDKEAEATEPENPDNLEEVIETSVPRKAKVQKENALRYRKTAKARGTLPKAILKKKKSNDYLIWGAAGGAVVVVLMLLALGYSYLL